jgi:hypothetical protein
MQATLSIDVDHTAQCITKLQYRRRRLSSVFWSPRISRTCSHARRVLTRAAMGMLLVTTPTLAPAQSVSGAMAVSATILPPDETRAPKLISFNVARTGIARVETAAPVAGAVSQIVMVTVSSPTHSFAPVTHKPMLVLGTPRGNRSATDATPSDASPATRQGYDVNVGWQPANGSTPDTASVRITYLIVPGT